MISHVSAEGEPITEVWDGQGQGTESLVRGESPFQLLDAQRKQKICAIPVFFKLASQVTNVTDPHKNSPELHQSREQPLVKVGWHVHASPPRGEATPTSWSVMVKLRWRDDRQLAWRKLPERREVAELLLNIGQLWQQVRHANIGWSRLHHLGLTPSHTHTTTFNGNLRLTVHGENHLKNENYPRDNLNTLRAQ